VRYYIWQIEVCPDTGREHAQGYIEFNRQVTLRDIKDIFNDNTLHIEERRGSQEDAIAYCKKDDTRKPGCTAVIWGTPAKPGARTDLNELHEVVEHVKTGAMTVSDVAIKHPDTFVRHFRGIERLAGIVQHQVAKSIVRPVQVFVLWGDAGTSKSTGLRMRLTMDGKEFYVLGNDRPSRGQTPWFDQYEGEQVLIFEDFTPEEFPFQFLLNVCEGYTQRLPTKGNFTYALWTEVWILSNLNPQHWYRGLDPELLFALKRRFTEVIHYQASNALRDLMSREVAHAESHVVIDVDTIADIREHRRVQGQAGADTLAARRAIRAQHATRAQAPARTGTPNVQMEELVMSDDMGGGDDVPSQVEQIEEDE
jgi:hypothetical protein